MTVDVTEITVIEPVGRNPTNLDTVKVRAKVSNLNGATCGARVTFTHTPGGQQGTSDWIIPECPCEPGDYYNIDINYHYPDVGLNTICARVSEINTEGYPLCTTPGTSRCVSFQAVSSGENAPCDGQPHGTTECRGTHQWQCSNGQWLDQGVNAACGGNGGNGGGGTCGLANSFRCNEGALEKCLNSTWTPLPVLQRPLIEDLMYCGWQGTWFKYLAAAGGAVLVLGLAWWATKPRPPRYPPLGMGREPEVVFRSPRKKATTTRRRQ